MDSYPGKPMVDQFRLLYAIDRELYTILVRDLSRNPSECLGIMGLWLWFECLGLPNVVSKIVGFTLVIIDQITDEAMTCLRVVNNQLPCTLKPGVVPLTCSLLETDVFVQYLQENKDSVFHEVNRLVSNVCIPGLSDLMERARHGGFGEIPAVFRPLVSVVEDSLVEDLSGLSLGNAAGPARGDHMSGLRRTMFAVFSEGSPVGGYEMTRFFTAMFGGCIESVRMHEAGQGEQPLYARIVFVRPSMVRSILNGNSSVRLVINGRAVWMMQCLPPRMLLPSGCPGEGPSNSRGQ